MDLYLWFLYFPLVLLSSGWTVWNDSPIPFFQTNCRIPGPLLMFWGLLLGLSALESLPSGSLHFNLFCAPLQTHLPKDHLLFKTTGGASHSIASKCWAWHPEPLTLTSIPKTPGSFILHCNYVHSHLIFLLTMNVSPGRVRTPGSMDKFYMATQPKILTTWSFTASLLTLI